MSIPAWRPSSGPGRRATTAGLFYDALPRSLDDLSRPLFAAGPVARRRGPLFRYFLLGVCLRRPAVCGVGSTSSRRRGCSLPRVAASSENLRWVGDPC